MANPDPEIAYDEARAVRPDAIVATGRSDYPNQVNNVLAFPSIFRGALDAHATKITEEMKVAAARAIAAIVREETPDEVLRAYRIERLQFGKEYILPKPFDMRVVLAAAPVHGDAGHTWHHPDRLLHQWVLDRPPLATVMPAFRGVLSDEQVLEVLAYIKSTWLPEIQERQDLGSRQYEAQVIEDGTE